MDIGTKTIEENMILFSDNSEVSKKVEMQLREKGYKIHKCYGGGEPLLIDQAGEKQKFYKGFKEICDTYELKI